MNKLVTHYRNSTQLKKEDLTQEEKEEIISTLNLVKKCESLEPEEREDEFMTMCFNYGLDDDQTRAAKEIFLGIEPSEIWEKNILALERGEWVDSMETKCFKRWNKQRPSLVATLEYIFQCKIADETTSGIEEGRLKDSMGDSTTGTISEGVVVQIARWINDEIDEAEAEMRMIQEIVSKRDRAKSTPTLLTRNSPPAFPTPPLQLSPSATQENDNEEKIKKGKKTEARNRSSPLTTSASPPSTPRKLQEEETERKAEIKRKKSKKHSERENLTKSAEEKKQNEVKDKRKISWVRKLSADRDLGKKKEGGENCKRRGSVDSLSDGTISVVFREEIEREKYEKMEKKEKEREEGKKGEKKDKKDKKGAPLLCWMGSSENLRTIDESSEFSRAMLYRSRDSPTQEKRREIESFAKVKSSQTKEMENLAKAKTIEVYQSFKM
eukprot:Phypoly_transcript_07889.p1 GENE.Phypoly_transcript_07889~~Phypoly_transcript_07889.p1  ORF type:complete len:439 (-),score=94.07 Phypoly_transcript_07889:62-1378(-)